MKKRLTLLLALITALFMFSGCIVTSINPLYTKDTVVFEEKLLGTWKDIGEHDDEMWRFTKHKGNDPAYDLMIIQDYHMRGIDKMHYSIEGRQNDFAVKSEGISRFVAVLIRLDGQLYLDMYPEVQEGGHVWYYLHTIPVHSFMKIDLEGDSLKLSFLNIDYLGKKIDNGEDIGVEYVVPQEEKYMILTSPTEKLQEFMMKNADNEEMFTTDEMERYPMIWTKQIPSTPEKSQGDVKAIFNGDMLELHPIPEEKEKKSGTDKSEPSQSPRIKSYNQRPATPDMEKESSEADEKTGFSGKSEWTQPNHSTTDKEK